MPKLATTLVFTVDADCEERPAALTAMREAKAAIEALGIDVTLSSRGVAASPYTPRRKPAGEVGVTIPGATDLRESVHAVLHENHRDDVDDAVATQGTIGNGITPPSDDSDASAAAQEMQIPPSAPPPANSRRPKRA